MKLAMKLAIALLCCAVAQAATEHRRPRRPVPVFCPARNCYCTPAVWGARVDCTVCRCTGCPRPAVADQEECAADPIKENPYYLSTQGTCELCAAANCNDEGCNSLGRCRKCARGFSKDAAGQCIVADLPGCEVASRDSALKCVRCTAGWSLNRRTGACVQCTAPGAASCYPLSPAVTTACLPAHGWVVDPVTRAKSCALCDPANVGCAVCNGDVTKCQKCVKLSDPAATEFYVLDTTTATCVAVPLV